MSNLIYWVWKSQNGKVYSCAICDGKMITADRTDAIAKLDGDLATLQQQRQMVTQDIGNAKEAHGLPLETIAARAASLPSLDAAIVVAENDLWAAVNK
jgi:hypothetical protein